MKLISSTFLLFTSLLLSACSMSPIVKDIRHDNVDYDAENRKTIISAIDSTTQFKIQEVTETIMQLGPDIDREEASFVAREAVLYPMHLANKYRLIAPPNSHNVLVNTGRRDRGLCYHWARDMTDHIVTGRTFKTLTLQRAVANQGRRYEHNVLTVAAKGKGIEDAYILDAWRNSGELLVLQTRDDPEYDCLLLLSACSTIRFDDVHVNKQGKTVVKAIDSYDNKKIQELTQAILTLGPGIVKSEAQFVAREAVLYPKVLANRYKLMSPPLYHNVLVNYGKRPRGLCYQWTHDMETIQNSLSLQWVSKKDAPEFLGKMIAAKAAASILAFTLVWLLFEFFHLDYKWIYIVGGGAIFAGISLLLAFNVPSNPEAGNETIMGRVAHNALET
ncbi:hypothetical protein GQR58_020375 [Nymphon striatum]|nr:hypothetical protein GQR58_020375 [Nymphon striatum]